MARERVLGMRVVGDDALRSREKDLMALLHKGGDRLRRQCGTGERGAHNTEKRGARRQRGRRGSRRPADKTVDNLRATIEDQGYRHTAQLGGKSEIGIEPASIRVRADGVIGGIPIGLLDHHPAELHAVLAERRLDDALLDIALMGIAHMRNHHQHCIDGRPQNEDAGQYDGHGTAMQVLVRHSGAFNNRAKHYPICIAARLIG